MQRHRIRYGMMVKEMTTSTVTKNVLRIAAAAVLILLLVIAVFSGAGAAGKYTDLHGKCGDNLEWRFENNPEDPDFDILHIYGTGPMWNAIHESGGRTHWDIYEWYGYRDWYIYDHPTCFSKVVIDSGVTSIGNNVFSDCNNIKTISIPNTVTSIGNNVFTDCKNLESVTLPNSVTSIGSEVFWGCTNLKSVTIPNGITSISEEMFMSSGIESVTLPESLKSIGNCAFARCANLESIVIPEKVTSIDKYAFFWCTNLKEIWIKGDITSIDGSVFFKVADGCTVHCTQKTAEILRSKYGSALNIIITGGSSPQSPGSGAESGSLEMTGANWMSFLPNSTSIGQINIPGSHDASAFNTQAQAYLSDMSNPIPIGDFLKCHNIDVTDQFESGARWFDFRFIYNASCSESPFYEGTAHDYLTVHGEAHCNTSDNQPYLFFKSGVEELSDELSKFNTEFAVITYQFESDFTGNYSIYKPKLGETESLSLLRGDIDNLCTNHSDKYLHIKNGDTLPTLGKARGKIIFIESGEYNKTEDHFETDLEGKKGHLKALWDKASLQNYNKPYQLSNSPDSPLPITAFASFTEYRMPPIGDTPYPAQSSAATAWIADNGYPFTKGNYYGVTLFNSVGIEQNIFAKACEKVYKSNAEICQLNISDSQSEEPISYEIRLGEKSLVMPPIEKDGHTIDGLFTSSSGGVQVADSNGCLIKSVSGYTNANGEWIKVSLEPVSLYVQWTEVPVESKPEIEIGLTPNDDGTVEIQTTSLGNTSVEVAGDNRSVTLTDTASDVKVIILFAENATADDNKITGNVSDIRAEYPELNALKKSDLRQIAFGIELTLNKDITGEIVLPNIYSTYNEDAANKAAEYGGVNPLATVTGSASSGKSLSQIKEVILTFKDVGTQSPVIYHVSGDGVVTPISSWSWNDENKTDLTVKSAMGFSTYVLAAVPEQQPQPQESSSSSRDYGSSVWLTATPTPTLTAEATAEPTPAQPTASPIKPTPQASTPAPVAGIIAGLGAAGVLFGLRRK